MLQEYESGSPGLAERIVRMAELPLEMAQSQLRHRQELEKRVLTSDIRSRWAGLASGLFLCVLAVVAGAWLIYEGRSVEGLAAIIGALGAPLGAFVYSEKRRRAELQRKDPFTSGDRSRHDQRQLRP